MKFLNSCAMLAATLFFLLGMQGGQAFDVPYDPYKTLLKAVDYLKEPSKDEVLSKLGSNEVYRVTLWHALGYGPSSYRVELDRKGRAKLIEAGYDYSDDKAQFKRDRRRLKSAELEAFLKAIESTDFWSLPNTYPLSRSTSFSDPKTGEEMALEEICMDGLNIWVEGFRGGQYHWSHHGCIENKLDLIVGAVQAMGKAQ